MAKIIPIPIGPIYNEGPCRGMVHVIEKGDTLYRLGKQYHVLDYYILKPLLIKRFLVILT